MELNDISNQTVLFSDRPNRIVEFTSTSNFIENWTVRPNSFAIGPPNAVLVYEDMQTGNLETIIIALFTPQYDSDEILLKYVIKNNSSTYSILSKDFGQIVLVIDTTQVGNNISNLISQVNTMKNNRIN